ncbi:MAG: hypothetical protein H0U32_07400 [Thermoleophilaceae bacterium]|nr:hypothetical protein [Thermoleophilaceae bacterium]
MDAQWLRHERIADTEGIGRLANEQIVKADANRSGEDETVLRCECGDDVCHEPLTVTRAVYESVRHDPMLFIVQVL